jgi:cytochrome c-type biogenesis protein CcmH/NrfG
MRVTLSKIKLAASVVALVALANGCGGGASNNARQSNAGAQSSPAQSNSNATDASNMDVAKLNADIERLEKTTERNPGDDDTRDELAQAYVRRGDAKRASGQPQEALKDYQNALRLDPDNGDAQKNAADIKEQQGGEQEDENGAPLPPPITPNVADDDKPSTPNEKPTPKKQ